MSNPQKPPGCDKNIDGDNLASLRDVSTDDMKALINSHAGDKCKNELLNSLQTAVDRGSTTSTWIEEHAGGSMGWSGGSANIGASAGRNTTNNDRIDEDSRTSAITEGCRQTLYNMNNSNTLYSQLACNMKSASNTIDSDIKMGASISIIVGPDEAMTAQHERHLAGIDATILALANKNPLTDVDVKAMEVARQMANDSIAKFRFDIRNSKFTITSNNIQNLKTTNNQAIDDNTKIKEAITKKATAEAVSTITQKYELGAGAVANLESYAGTKINDTSLTTAMDIIAAANDTKVEVDQQGNITLKVKGSLDGINVDITQGNLTELRSELVMKAATSLGRDIANEIIHEQMTKTEAQLEALGLVSLQKAIADGLAAQAKALEQPDMFGGGGLFGGMFGGMFGKIAMIAIPIIIILVLFSMFGFKIALVAGLLFGIYLAIAYFVGLPPFSKEKNETDLVQRLYDDIMKYLIIPRRRILFASLFETLTVEKNRVMSLENGSQNYLDKLNNAQDWIKEESGKPFLLTRLSNREPGPPNWFKSVIYNVERDTYDILINMLEDVTNNNGDVFRDKTYPGPVIPRLKEDRYELTQFFQMYILDSFESDKHDAAYVSAIRAANSNPPGEWQRILSEYQWWIQRGRPSIQASTSSQSRPVQMASMDTQQAYGTVGQGYPMADMQQGYVAAQPQTVESHITQAKPHQVQKSYTNSNKKKDMYSMKKMQNTYDNTKDISKKGYEMRVAQMVQREYSRNRDSIKPAYNKPSVYKK